MTDDRLDGYHVVVTGAAKGIGRGISLRASQSGADVTVFDVDAEGAAETANLIRNQGSRAETCEVDVTEMDVIESGIEAATDALGPIDGFVNNAGIQDVLPILETSGEQWDRYMAVNAKGTFLCSKAVAHHMIEENVKGSIVNVASAAAVDPSPGQGAYGASKGAVAAFTIVLAKELAEHGVNANSINPGGVETQMFRKWVAQHADAAEPDIDATLAEMKSNRGGIRSLGRPEDVGHLATFLLSDEAAWISGEAFGIKGALD